MWLLAFGERNLLHPKRPMPLIGHPFQSLGTPEAAFPASPNTKLAPAGHLPPAQASSEAPSPQMSPYCSVYILTFGLTPSFSSRSFENNLNTYKRLAIKLPDSQIRKVGDAVLCHVPASGSAWVLL